MVNEEAESYKVKGNEALKNRNFQDAVNFYNKSITLDDSNAVYYSNRSAAWAEMKKWESSLADAIKCIEKNRSFIKGYARKATALEQLGKKEEAKQAYQEGLAIDPQNAACKAGIQGLTARARPSAGGGGGFQHWVDKAKEFLGGGGSRLKSYVLIFGVYMLYKQFQGGAMMGGAGSGGGPVDIPFGRQYLTIGTHRISYILKGTEGPGVLLLHQPGLSWESEMLPLMNKLEDNMRVLAIDLPCNGYSDCFDLKLSTLFEKISGVWSFNDPAIITSGASARFLQEVHPSKAVLVNPELDYPPSLHSLKQVLAFVPVEQPLVMARDVIRYSTEQVPEKTLDLSAVNNLSFPHLWLSEKEVDVNEHREYASVTSKFALLEEETQQQILQYIRPKKTKQEGGHEIDEEEES